jgi:hypothetical protein
MAYSPSLDLAPVFFSFSGQRNEMDGRQWVKLCTDVELFDDLFSQIDADLIFSKVKPPRRRKIDFAEFETALAEVAARKGAASETVYEQVRTAGGPVFRTAVPTSDARRGPSRFFYDQSTYTGVHTRGGPTTVDSGRGGPIHDISHICRSNSDKRGVTEYDNADARSLTSLDPGTCGVGSKLDPHVPPRTTTLHMASDITSGPRGTSSTGDTPTTRGSPSPIAQREWNASTSLESPRTPAWPPRVCISPRRFVSGPATPQKLKFSPVARRQVSPEPSRARGPARFFYDRSTWTGCQANALAAEGASAERSSLNGFLTPAPKKPIAAPYVSADAIGSSERRPVMRPPQRHAAEQGATGENSTLSEAFSVGRA